MSKLRLQNQDRQEGCLHLLHHEQRREERPKLTTNSSPDAFTASGDLRERKRVLFHQDPPVVSPACSRQAT